MGGGESKEPEPIRLEEVPVNTEINVESTKIVTSGADLTKFLPEIATFIVRKKAEKAELAKKLADDPNEASRVVNTIIPTGDYSGLLLLHIIALYGIDDEEAAKIIVQLTLDVNKTVPSEEGHAGGSALHLCATTNNATIATHLLMLRTDVVVDLRDSQGFSPLHRAIISGSTGVARLILRRYPELADQSVDKDPEKAGTMAGMNCLHLAVIASLNGTRQLRAPLYHLVDFLLKQGCDVNAHEANAGATPIHFAAARGVNDLLYLMLNSRDVKDSIDDSAGLNALHVAAISNQLVPINMLLMRGFDINSRGGRGETPVMCAAMANSLDALRHLLEKGADAKLADDTGSTALHYAAATASPDAVFEILNLTEANINSVDHKGGTALHTLSLRYTSLPPEAAQKTCQILLDFAIDADISDEFGNRAYKYLPADDKEAQTLFGRSHLFNYDNFHDRHLEDENQSRLPIGLPRLPVSRRWLEDMIKNYGQGAEGEYRREFEKRLYYFPGEPRRTPPLEREPEWWTSETTFPYTEANKVLADRQDIGPRYPAAIIPLGPDPLAETYDSIAPKLDEMGNVIRQPWQRSDDRSHELPTRVRPDRRTLEVVKGEVLKRNYVNDVLDEQNQEEQDILDAKQNQKWWMRSDFRNGVDRMPTRKRASKVPPGMAKDEMLLQPDIEFPPDVDIRKHITDDDVPNRTPEEWVRTQIDDKAARVRRPPTASRAKVIDPNAPENIRFEDQWRQPSQQQAQPQQPQPQSQQITEPAQTVPLYAPDGQQVEVIARRDGRPDVRVIQNPVDGQPIQVVEGPGGQALRVYEAPNGQPVIMPGPNGQSAVVLGNNGEAIRLTRRQQQDNDGRYSAGTSSVVSSKLGSPTPRTRYDEQPTRMGPEYYRAADRHHRQNRY